MARQQRRSSRPAWLDLIERPAVLQVLAALHHHGPHSFHPLCAYADLAKSTSATTSAIRKLAAFGLLRCHGHSGSLDEPSPEALYELTQQGHQFADAWCEIERVLAEQRRGHR